MSDRIAVMSEGRIEQVDSPDRLYDAPRSAFVATFVGENNVLRGKVGQQANGMLQAETPLGPVRAANPRGLRAGADAMVFVRPERVQLGARERRQPARAAGSSAASWRGRSPISRSRRAAGQTFLVHQTNRGDVGDAAARRRGDLRLRGARCAGAAAGRARAGLSDRHAGARPDLRQDAERDLLPAGGGLGARPDRGPAAVHGRALAVVEGARRRRGPAEPEDRPALQRRHALADGSGRRPTRPRGPSCRPGSTRRRPRSRSSRTRRSRRPSSTA